MQLSAGGAVSNPMNTLTFARRFTTALAATGAMVLLTACAATPKPSPVAEVGNKVMSATPKADCLQTGTRILLKAGECSAATGRVYTKDELDRTGQTDTAEALRQLDPSIGR